MGRWLVGSLLLSCLLAIALWQAAAFFSRGAPPLLAGTSFYPPPGNEAIQPIPKSLPLDARKVALGRRLFHDPRLSGDNSVACASCHDLARGGVDGRPRSQGVRGETAELNAPTVFNSVFNFRQFWDGRAATLEDQIDGPVQNPKEMASSWPDIIAKLSRDEQYARQFRAVYGGIEAAHVKSAIAEFERSLITPGSRFDRYLQGERNALTPQELAGYQLFKSYGCIACHQGVNVGGNLYQRLGVMSAYFTGDAETLPANQGRARITGQPDDLHVFKVPSLRNVALTAPYFHDGSVPSLEQAVLIMAQYQLGVALSPGDTGLIVSFLRTLTGEEQQRLP